MTGFNTVPDWISYNAQTGKLTIYGKTYDAHALGRDGVAGPKGTILRVESEPSDPNVQLRWFDGAAWDIVEKDVLLKAIKVDGYTMPGVEGWHEDLDMLVRSALDDGLIEPGEESHLIERWHKLPDIAVVINDDSGDNYRVVDVVEATPKADDVVEPASVASATALVSESGFPVGDAPDAPLGYDVYDEVTEAAAQLDDAERLAIFDWCMAVHLYASDNEDVIIPPKPEKELDKLWEVYKANREARGRG